MDELSLALIATEYLDADDVLSFHAQKQDLQNPLVTAAWEKVQATTQILQQAVYRPEYVDSDLARKIRELFAANLSYGGHLNEERQTKRLDRKARKAHRQTAVKALQKVRQAVKAKLEPYREQARNLNIVETELSEPLEMTG